MLLKFEKTSVPSLKDVYLLFRDIKNITLLIIQQQDNNRQGRRKGKGGYSYEGQTRKWFDWGCVNRDSYKEEG